MALIIKNPATNQVIKKVKTDTKASLTEKIAILKKGQKAWYATSIEERVKILLRFHDLLETHKEDLAATLTAEVGKPLQQSRNEINGAKTRIKWLCENAEKYLKDEWMVEQADMGERIVYEPLGVICNISAWNYPYLVGTNVIIPALLAGNAVMYKPSEYATLTGMNIQKLLLEAGVPSDAFATAVGTGRMGAALLALPFDGYFFTGSYKTGKYIYQKVAPKMVPCQLELGGKDPLYVADDVADIKNVAIGTADGAFYNNGQSCCSVERIYVHEKVYDAYLTAFVSEVASWKIGDPTEGGVYIGALTREAQIKVLENQVKEALEKGATLLCGGKRIDCPGNYFAPTVLTNVTNDMAVMQEESFGPIIGIMKVSNDAEATALMNDTAYGLTAAVYSSSQKRAEQILSNIDSGSGYWNCCDRVSPALPWSGRKHSGIGATLSHIGLRAFTQPKAYHFLINITSIIDG
jgi:acyl-CoA reductase-like NAD-dependent aldehyde dehydrogenase